MVTAPETAVADHLPLTTSAGWRRFVDEEVPSPNLLVSRDYRALTATDQASYDEQRLDYHSRPITVATPAIRQVYAIGRRLVLLNRHQLSGRRGQIVSGLAGTGKTTAITELGRNHERLFRRRLGSAADGLLPVVYITVPPRATPKMIAIELARFLGLPTSRTDTQTTITNAVCDLLIQLRVELVLIDEIHNITPISSKAGAEASDQIKYLSERIPATFVLAGIDVVGSGMFAGPRGQQIASRYTLKTTEAFAYGTPSQREDWRKVVATLEASLRLHRHRRGHLEKLDKYLFERTEGMIGSLSQLIRGAAVEAILNDKEAITKEVLAAVELDHAVALAEAERAAAKQTRPPRNARSA